MQLGLHVREVGLPVATRRSVVERVGIRVDVDAAELSPDDAAQHAPKGLVVVGKAHVGPHLGTRIAQPHGVNVARIDKRVVVAVGRLAIVDGGLQRVGEAVLEHPSQLRIVLEQPFHLLDLPLYGFGTEQALFHRRTLGEQRTCGVGRHLDVFTTEGLVLACDAGGPQDGEGEQETRHDVFLAGFHHLSKVFLQGKDKQKRANGKTIKGKYVGRLQIIIRPTLYIIMCIPHPTRGATDKKEGEMLKSKKR